jgi:hypothetical protein
MTQHIFLHIPKTAGSSIRTLLKQNYPEGKTIGFSGQPEALNWYRARPAEFKRRHTLVHGHFAFGLHDGVAKYTYFTLLRDPVDRHFSDYFFLKRYENHPLHDAIARGSITLDDWSTYASGHPWYRDTSTRLVSGEHMTRNPDPATIEKAKYHLRTDFTFAGLSERFDESVLILAKRLGWTSVLYLTRNVSVDRTEVPMTLREKTREYLRFDYELYEFAQRAFDEAPELRDPCFAAALAELRDTRNWLETEVANDQHALFVLNGDLPSLDAIARQHRRLDAIDAFLAA